MITNDYKKWLQMITKNDYKLIAKYFRHGLNNVLNYSSTRYSNTNDCLKNFYELENVILIFFQNCRNQKWKKNRTDF